MTISPLAGRPAPPEMPVDLARLEREYFEHRPDPDTRDERVSFGTSGNRGSPFRGSFTEARILAITQAICVPRETVRPSAALKVVTRNGRFAARPSRSEAVYKVYAESFGDEKHPPENRNRSVADREQCSGRRIATISRPLVARKVA